MSFLRPVRLIARPAHGLDPLRAILGSAGHGSLTRRFATKPRQPLPTVQTCPSPSCGCAATPSYPEGLEIDHKSPLNGVITGYSEHVLVCTGQDDWTSKIEEENSGDNLAADLKELFGRGGKLSDVSSLHSLSLSWFICLTIVLSPFTMSLS